MEYFAFISYKREDEKWAKWLQNKLEHYKLPSNLNGRTDLPKEIRPVFRDQSDLAAGVLADEIQKALETSKYLILICSPLAAQSQWVGKEVQSFIDMGRTDKIIPFIVDGKARAQNQEEECFPSALLNLPADKELLGVNINEMGRDAAAVKVVAQMFGLKFDVLWQRFGKEQKKKRVMTTIVVAVMVLTGLFVASLVRKQRIEVEKQRAEAEMQRMKAENENWLKIQNQSRYLAEMANELVDKGLSYEAQRILLEAFPQDLENPDRPFSPNAEMALRNAVFHDNFDLGEVGNAKFSPDGKKIVIAACESLKIWDSETRLVTRFPQYEVLDADFSPDGKNIAVGLYAGGILILDSESGNELRKFGGQESIHSIDYSPDGNLLVTTTDYEKLQVWDLKSGKQLYDLGDLVLYYVFDVAQFSPDGKQILFVSSGSSDTTFSCNINIMDAVDGGIQQVHELEGGVYCVGYAPDNSFVYAVTYDWELHMWETHNGKELPMSSEKAIAFGPDEKKCIFNGDDIRIVDNGAIKKVIKGAAYCDVARFSPNGKYILTITDDNDVVDQPHGILNIWDANVCGQEIRGHTSWIKSIDYSPDGDLLVSSSYDNTIRVWDVKSGKEIRQLSCKAEHAVFSPDGKQILISGHDSIYIWNYFEKKELFKAPCFYYHLDGHGYDYSPDGKRIATIVEDGMRIIDSKTGETINQVKGDFRSVGYNNDGSQIVITDSKGGCVWKSESCELLSRFNYEDYGYDFNDCGYDNPRAFFSPDGQLILLYIVEEGGEVCSPIHAIDVKTKEEVFCLNDYEYYSVFFSPDSKRIIVDNSVYDIESGSEVARLENIHDFVFSPDGRNIAWDRNNTICISEFLSLQELINITRERFKDNPLTPKERSKYHLD